MPLPQVLAERLKHGLMARAEEKTGVWTLYEPASDLTCTLREDEPVDGELGLTDLESSERAWSSIGLNVDRYHASQAFRTHRDAREANLEINSVCHYACKHCFQDLEPSTVPEATPSLSEIIAAARRLLDAGANEISITGGDIFLQPAIWELLDFFQREAPKVSLRLLINGGGLDLDNPVTRVRLKSLTGRRLLFKSDFFGHTAELHDAFTRVPGSFARLLRIFEFLSSEGIPTIATAALTRQNFDTRFELVNFLYNLTKNRFTVSTIVYPTENRKPEALAEIRLTATQYAELLEERFFSPLVAEYHTFEPQCGGDCQFAVVSTNGITSGCSFLKDTATGLSLGNTKSLPVLDEVRAWRNRAVQKAVVPDCANCSARLSCRHCPSFVAAAGYAESYCSYSRLAHTWLTARAQKATESGFRFIHSLDAVRAGIEGGVDVPTK